MTSNDEEVRLLYLLTGSFDVFPFSCHKLRSYLNTHISTIADQHNLQLMKSFRSRHKTCPYCYTPWHCETTSLKLLPSKKCKSIRKGTIETKSKELRNTLVLKCKVCTKKSLFSLVKEKPQKISKTEVIESGKKRKKKDKTCGLIVNLKQSDDSGERIILKKKKRKSNVEETRYTDTDCSEPKKFLPVSKNQLNTVSSSSSKKLVLNPFAVQPCNKFNRKTDKKLQRLKESIKNNKNVARKSLMDFLTLV